MPPMPEIDTAAIRARAEAAHNEVAGLADGSREWRMHIPVQPERDSDTVISASLADVDTLLVALAAAFEVGRQQGVELEALRSDARNIRRIIWPTFVRHPEPPDTGQLLAPAVKWLRDAWRAVVDAGLASGAPEEFATKLAADHARMRWTNNALRLAVTALEHDSASCRYHGTEFDKLGMERGEPRCDSCKQPFRVRKALDAAATLDKADAAAVAELDGTGSGARIAVDESEPVSVRPDEGLPVSDDLRVAYRAPGQFRRDAGTAFVCRRRPEIGELIVHPCPDCGHPIALHVATAECPVCRLVELTTPAGRRREARERGVFIP